MILCISMAAPSSDSSEAEADLPSIIIVLY